MKLYQKPEILYQETDAVDFTTISHTGFGASGQDDMSITWWA